MVVKPSTKDVYLIVNTDSLSLIDDFHRDIFDYLGVTESTSTSYKGLLLDGGTSTQIHGKNNFSHSTTLGRAVPQIISVDHPGV